MLSFPDAPGCMPSARRQVAKRHRHVNGAPAHPEESSQSPKALTACFCSYGTLGSIKDADDRRVASRGKGWVKGVEKQKSSCRILVRCSLMQ